MQKDDRIDRYLLGQMNEREAEEFETYFIANPACLEQLELAERLHRGIKDLAHDPLFENVRVDKVPTPVWQKQVPAWSLAAAVAIAVAIPTYLLRPTAPTLESVQVVSVELAGIRSSTQRSINLELRNQQSLLSFYVDTEVPTFNYSQFEFVLRNDQDSVVFTSTELSLNNASTLYVNLGTKNFESGEYQYELYGIANKNRQLMQSGKANIK